MSQTSTVTATNVILLSEEYIQECFHSYLKSSLTQAKAEHLLGTDMLSSAEGDLMITGPALCLYFAALRSTTNPPSVPLPRKSKTRSAPTDLSLDNCPVSFRPFLTVWSHTVPRIQGLSPEYQHDLARIICGLPPLTSPHNLSLNGISADLRAVAIEISMRRTFQDKYANDLQAAIDAGGDGTLKVVASFVPPPSYDDTSPSPPMSPSSSRSKSLPPTPSPEPTIFGVNSPAIEFVRETLYAALADVLERMPSLRKLLRSDPPRAYFAAVAFAILDVATTSANMTHVDEEPAVRGILGQTLTVSQCPEALRPFMSELCNIGRMAQEMEEEDSRLSVEALSHGHDLPPPRIDRVRGIIQSGVGHAFIDSDTQTSTSVCDARRRTTSTENRAVAFANRINGLALSMTKLRAFRERQEDVFKVLVGVSG